MEQTPQLVTPIYQELSQPALQSTYNEASHVEGSRTQNTSPLHPIQHILSNNNVQDVKDVTGVRIVEGAHVVYQPLSKQLMSAPPIYAGVNQTTPLYQPLSIDSVHQSTYTTTSRTTNYHHPDYYEVSQTEHDYEPTPDVRTYLELMK